MIRSYMSGVDRLYGLDPLMVVCATSVSTPMVLPCRRPIGHCFRASHVMSIAPAAWCVTRGGGLAPQSMHLTVRHRCSHCSPPLLQPSRPGVVQEVHLIAYQ